MTVGEFIKQKRIAKGLTIEQLSQLCNSNDSAFSRIENNKRDVEFSLLTTLCKVLEFTPNELAESTGFSVPPSDPESFDQELFEVKKQAIKDFMKEFGMTMAHQVVALHKMGTEKKEAPIPIEGVIPVHHTNETRKYPLLSDKSACGFSLIPAEDEIEDFIDIPERYNIPAEFILQAKGDCLDNEKIHDGYLVFVKRQETASSGDIVAVRVIENSHGHAILKKLRIMKGNMFLTDKSDEIIEFTENMSIIGKAVYWMPDLRKFG